MEHLTLLMNSSPLDRSWKGGLDKILNLANSRWWELVHGASKPSHPKIFVDGKDEHAARSKLFIKLYGFQIADHWVSIKTFMDRDPTQFVQSWPPAVSCLFS